MSGPENPPAFPPALAIAPSGDVYPGYDGMTLRDWFAGMALCGLSGHISGTRQRQRMTQAESEAAWAYERADAMLAERGRKA